MKLGQDSAQIDSSSKAGMVNVTDIIEKNNFVSINEKLARE